MSRTPAQIATQPLPIFPLRNVLFPAGQMKLSIFEPRYMEMIAECMKQNASFGICLIETGAEVGEAAKPFAVGVEARIVDWDLSEEGLLGLTVRGERRFRIREAQVNEHELVTAEVEWLPEPAAPAPSPDLVVLLPLLHAIIADAGPAAMPPPYHFDDPNWVGYRYADVLPIPALAKQRLLELDDANLRLSIISEFLRERGLLKR